MDNRYHQKSCDHETARHGRGPSSFWMHDSKRIFNSIFSEVCRILKPGKRLAIIECKKEEMPFGPPKHMRLSTADIENSIQGYDFYKFDELDLGHNYMVHFVFNPKETANRDNFRYYLAQCNEL